MGSRNQVFAFQPSLRKVSPVSFIKLSAQAHPSGFNSSGALAERHAILSSGVDDYGAAAAAAPLSLCVGLVCPFR